MLNSEELKMKKNSFIGSAPGFINMLTRSLNSGKYFGTQHLLLE